MESPTQSPKRPAWYALFIVLIFTSATLAWIYHPKYFYFHSDEPQYTQISYALSSFPKLWRKSNGGGYQAPNGAGWYSTATSISEFRYSVTVPVALLYRILGVSEITTKIWPFSLYLLSLILILLMKQGKVFAITGLLLLASNPAYFVSSLCLLPDLPSAVFSFPFLMLINRRNSLCKAKKILTGTFIAAVSISIALLAKETAIWAIAIWLGVLLYDVAYKRRSHVMLFHTLLSLNLLILFGIFLLFSYFHWGDLFARFSAVDQMSGNHWWSWRKLSPDKRFSRLTIEPLGILVHELAPIFWISLIGVFYFFKRIKFWIASCFIILLLWWFGSISLKFYEPLPAIYRMILPLFIPLTCVAATTLQITWNTSFPLKRGVHLFLDHRLLLLCIALSTFLLCFPQTGTLLSIVAILLLVMSLYIPRSISKMILFSLSLLTLCFSPHNYKGEKHPTHEPTEALSAVKIIKETLSEGSCVALFSTSSLIQSGVAYYFGYRFPEELTVKTVSSIEQLSLPLRERTRRLLFRYTPTDTMISSAFWKSLENSGRTKTLFKERGVILYEFTK